MEHLVFEDFDKYLIDHKGKIIHQLWFGTIPNKREAKKAYKKLKLYRDSWLVKNPNWLRVEWDKNMCFTLVKKFFPEHLEMFQKYKHEIQRCDAIRYFILYRYGGWYVDMDYYCNRPLDEALQAYQNDIYFVQTPNSFGVSSSDHISNSLMYSKPNHPYWKLLFIELEKNQQAPVYYSKHLTVMTTTGPLFLNRVYSRFKTRYKVKSLPWKLFHPWGLTDEKMLLNSDPNLFAIHIGKGSWEDNDSKFLLCIAREWKIILIIILLLIIPLFFNSKVNQYDFSEPQLRLDTQ